MNKLKALIPLVIGTFLITPSLGMDKELESIIKESRKNEYAAVALKEEEKFRNQTIKEIDNLFLKIHLGKGGVENIEDWQHHCIQGIEKDGDFFSSLTELKEASYPLKNHKMLDVSKEAIKLLENYFDILVKRELPNKTYAYDTEQVTILGDEKTFWGNGKGSNLKEALYRMFCHISQKPTSIQNLNLFKLEDEDTLSWIDQSATVNVIPLPETKEAEEVVEKFKGSIHYFSDKKILNGFVEVHSGYSFGGGRPNSRYEKGNLKVYGPFDCSSGIAYKYLNQEVIYTGMLKECYTDKDHRLRSFLTPVIDPEKVSAGQLYVHTKGFGGHTAVILGQRENGNIVTLGHNRNRPTLEGLGIQEFLLKPNDDRTVMIFDIKNKE